LRPTKGGSDSIGKDTFVRTQNTEVAQSPKAIEVKEKSNGVCGKSPEKVSRENQESEEENVKKAKCATRLRCAKPSRSGFPPKKITANPTRPERVERQKDPIRKTREKAVWTKKAIHLFYREKERWQKFKQSENPRKVGGKDTGGDPAGTT